MPAINPANSDAGRALRAQQAAARSASSQRPKPRPAAGLPPLLSAPAQAQPAQAPTRPRPRPKPKPQPKTGLAKLVNDIQYELGPKGGTGRAFRRAGRQIVRDVVKDAKQAQRNPVTAVLPIPGGALPRVGYVERNVGTAVLGAVDNAARLGYSAAQRMSGAKKADPTAGPVGAFLDQFVERGYRALGSKPPSQMSQAEVDRDQFRRSMGGGLLAAPLGTLGLAGRALQATTMAGKVGYSGAAFALNGLISNVFEDSTGGNPVNFINQTTGAKLPGAVNVGQDDRVDSFWKSLLPNLGADLAVGGVVGGGLAVGGKSLRAMGVPLKHTKAHLAKRWAARGETAERAEQAAAGVVRQDPESGAYAFSPPEPKPEPPKPTDAPQAAPEPWQPPPMPEQAAPEFDPWTQSYDPALPTSTGLGRAIGDLSDQELRAISTGEGPVVPRVEEALAARDQAMAMPAAPAQVLPTDVLPDEYLAALPNKWRGMADGDKPFDLAPLFDPEVNPSIWKRAQAMTGADEPGQLTPTDMADVLDAMLSDGQAVVPSRMGAEMMPVAGIRRPVPAADPAAVDPAADPWSSPSDMPDLPDQALWDPRQEGSIKIKDGPNGPEVVDGNKRLGLAQRLGVEQVPVVRDGGAPTPADAAQPRPQIELDPAERARIKQELIKAAAEGGEIRPPDAPIPAFSDMPVRRLDEVDMDKPVEPGSPEAQALLDEARLAADAMRERAAMDRAATEAARDAEGYELKTFEQKKAEGLVRGYKADPGAEQAQPPPPVAGPTAPERPTPVRLASGTGDQPEFTLPPALKKPGITYGSRKIRFASDLDRAAYALLEKKNPKLQPELRAALDAAGIDPGSVVNHAIRVRKALKKSNPSGDGVIDLPAQPWEGLRRPASPAMAATGQAPDPGMTPSEIAQWTEVNSMMIVEVKRLMPQIREEIRHVLGDEADLRIHNAFKTEPSPIGWGGGGDAEIQGMYVWAEDTVNIWARTDPALFGLPVGTRPGSLQPREIIRAGIHESVHRIVRRALSDSELRLLQQPKSKALIKKLGQALYSERQIIDMAYDELLTEAITEYVVLRRAGRDAWKELLDKSRLRTEATTTPSAGPSSGLKIAKQIAESFPAFRQAAEKVYNFIRKSKDLWDGLREKGNGAQVRDLLESIQQGLARGSVADLRPALVPNPKDPGNPYMRLDNQAMKDRYDKVEYWQMTNANGDLLDGYFQEIDKAVARGDWRAYGQWQELKQKVDSGLFDRDLVSIQRIKTKAESQVSALMKKLQDIEDKYTKGGCL
jgi:hypothetical protein